MTEQREPKLESVHPSYPSAPVPFLSETCTTLSIDGYGLPPASATLLVPKKAYDSIDSLREKKKAQKQTIY